MPQDTLTAWHLALAEHPDPLPPDLLDHLVVTGTATVLATLCERGDLTVAHTTQILDRVQRRDLIAAAWGAHVRACGASPALSAFLSERRGWMGEMRMALEVMSPAQVLATTSADLLWAVAAALVAAQEAMNAPTADPAATRAHQHLIDAAAGWASWHDPFKDVATDWFTDAFTTLHDAAPHLADDAVTHVTDADLATALLAPRALDCAGTVALGHLVAVAVLPALADPDRQGWIRDLLASRAALWTPEILNTIAHHPDASADVTAACARAVTIADPAHERDAARATARWLALTTAHPSVPWAVALDLLAYQDDPDVEQAADALTAILTSGNS